MCIASYYIVHLHHDNEISGNKIVLFRVSCTLALISLNYKVPSSVCKLGLNIFCQKTRRLLKIDLFSYLTIKKLVQMSNYVISMSFIAGKDKIVQIETNLATRLKINIYSKHSFKVKLFVTSLTLKHLHIKTNTS